MKKKSNNNSRRKGKYLILVVLIVVVFSVVYVANKNEIKMGASKSQTKDIVKEKDTKDVDKDPKDGKSVEETIEKSDKTKDKVSGNNAKKEEKSKEGKSSSFKVNVLEKEYEPTFNTPWKTSPKSKNLKACIEGKGPNAIEEGKGTLYIKSISDNKMYTIEPVGANPNYTLKYVDWWDNEHVMVILGMAHGTVGKGGELHLVNISSGKGTLLQETLNGKIQVISAVREGDTIKAKMIEFVDDNFNDYKEEEKIFSEIKLN